MRWARALAPAAALALLAACPVRGAPLTRVTVTLALQGGAGTALHGVDAVLALPAGAVLESDPATGRVAPKALRLEGGATNAVMEGRFTPHAKAPSVRLLVASLAPLPRGPVVSLTMTVPGGVPSASAFEVASALVAGESGAPVGNAGLLVAEVRLAPEPRPAAGAPPASGR
jgi:hypothetical protein